MQAGAIVAERYAEGFSEDIPLPGWSMAKSVTSTIVGLLVDAGRIDIHAPVGLEEWSSPDDPRATITWDQLLRMSSGLSFAENYSRPSSDAIQMLFGPIGMTSAVLEPDASGTYAGSSFLYATARDWARFGLLYLEQGSVDGDRILSPQWIAYTATPTPTEPAGTYGAHWWLNADPKTGTRRMPSLAPNILIASGFEGQSVVVVPDHDLVVVRLGLDRKDRLDIEELVAGVIAGLPADTSP